MSEPEVLVLFGAGVYAKKYKSLLDFLGIEFSFFTDNDKSKWGGFLYGKKIITPSDLLKLNCKILISCTHGEAITKQLGEMGIADRVLEMEELCNAFRERIRTLAYKVLPETDKARTVIVDMYEGVGWGGTEIWAATVAKGLKKEGYPVFLFGSEEQKRLDTCYEEFAERFGENDTIQRMVQSMLGKMPFTLINNFAGCAYLAAVMLKMQYPDKIRILNVIHNDNISLFKAHMVFGEWVDATLCVSEKIRYEMLKRYSLNAERVYFKEQPVDVEADYKPVFSSAGTPLRIGYAARIVRQQKRADLFPDLIRELERRRIDYLLEIAGEGECSAGIEAFILENKLEGKVKLLGRLPKEKMPDFWKRQDIFLNFSEYEGTSLSMLEAMSYTCVPVVTDVSGVREFVKSGENGYICKVGDLEKIAEAIQELDIHREYLERFGLLCREEICRRCSIHKYIAYISHIIEETE